MQRKFWQWRESFEDLLMKGRPKCSTKGGGQRTERKGGKEGRTPEENRASVRWWLFLSWWLCCLPFHFFAPVLLVLQSWDMTSARPSNLEIQMWAPTFSSVSWRHACSESIRMGELVNRKAGLSGHRGCLSVGSSRSQVLVGSHTQQLLAHHSS